MATEGHLSVLSLFVYSICAALRLFFVNVVIRGNVVINAQGFFGELKVFVLHCASWM